MALRTITFVLLLAVTLSAQPADVDVLKVFPAAEAQRFVRGSTIVGRRSEPGNAYRVVYADQKFAAIPLVTVQVRREKDPAAALKQMVALDEKLGTKKAQPLPGVGDEAFREDTAGRVYFRKGDAVGYVTGKGFTGTTIDVVELTKALIGKL